MFFLSHKAVIEGQCCYVIVMIIGRVILTILLWVICSLKALYNFVTSSIFYTVRTISVVLIILTILYWIQIGTASTFHVESDGTTDENTFNIINSKVNLIIIYKRVTSLNVLCMIIISLRHLKISNKILILYEVFSDSLSEVTFFLMVQFIVLLAYSFVGHMRFGIVDEDYKTIGESILTLYESKNLSFL